MTLNPPPTDTGRATRQPTILPTRYGYTVACQQCDYSLYMLSAQGPSWQGDYVLSVHDAPEVQS